MAILINFFDNVILQAISEEIVPKVSFFKDRYFPTGAGDIFKAVSYTHLRAHETSDRVP